MATCNEAVPWVQRARGSFSPDPWLLVLFVFQECAQKTGELRFLLQDGLKVLCRAVAARELGKVGRAVFHRVAGELLFRP
jgi:hypothetical protein